METRHQGGNTSLSSVLLPSFIFNREKVCYCHSSVVIFTPNQYALHVQNRVSEGSDLYTSALETEYYQDYSRDRSDSAKDCLKAKEAVLSISKSIVSLASSIDGSPLFACTGAVVDHVGSETWIITTANLVRKPDNDYEAYEGADIKIEVVLYNKNVIEGCLSTCNLQYNVAVVTIQSRMDLLIVPLSDIPGYYSLLPRPVVAVCRDFESRALVMRGGEMIRKTSNLDCNELLICTCSISEDFGGGPVMDLELGIIGIAFFDEEATPVLPIEIVTRCLKHFKLFRMVKQPGFCIRGRAFHMLEVDKLAEICYKYPNLASGILVEKIFKMLPENCGGIEAGDIISELDGITLNSVAQFTAILLDKVEIAINLQKTVVLKAIVHRPRDNSTFSGMLNVRDIASGEFCSFFNNRWTLP